MAAAKGQLAKRTPWKAFTTVKGGEDLARRIRAAIKDVLPAEGVYVAIGNNAGVLPAAARTRAFAPADPSMFNSHLYGKAAKRTPQSFWSITTQPSPKHYGTRLVIPPLLSATRSRCGDVMSFSQLPLKQQGRFWRTVAAEAEKLVKAGWTVWVHTHGREVPWLHVRIEARKG